jgi:GNAT superfamily N-acetyltransferase
VSASTIAVEYLPFTDWDSVERPYPPDVEPLRLQAFPSHKAIEVRPDGVYLIQAKVEDCTVGYALVEEPRRQRRLADNAEELFAYLAEVVVDESHRGRGIGSALVQEAGRVVQDLMEHCSRIWVRFLFHDGQLDRRHSLFGRFGFVPQQGGDDFNWVADAARVAQGPSDFM